MEILLSGICGDMDIIPNNRDEKATLLREKLKIRAPQNFYIPYTSYKLGDWKRFIATGSKARFWPHQTASEIKQYLTKDIWDSYYKFCFERNPYDRYISHHYFHTKKKNLSVTVDESISNRIDKKGCHSRLYRENGLVIVDKVYPYERMSEALSDISEKLNLEKPLDLSNIKAKGDVRIDRRPYSGVLSKDTIHKVNVSERDVFDLLNYEMILTP